jgi:hypothetical protein
MAQGEASIDFGVFPGESDASVTITGQTNILSTSNIEAWIMPKTTADHSADEHMVETIRVFADKSSIVVGTSFVIKGFNTSQLNETPLGWQSSGSSRAGGSGQGTRLYGVYNVGWAGDYT